MNTLVKSILDNDDELFNRVIALGAGDGINRVRAVVDDVESINIYGLRETVLEIPTITSYSELLVEAENYLLESGISSPIREIDFEYYFNSDSFREALTFAGNQVTYDGEPLSVVLPSDPNRIERGDTIRVAVPDIPEDSGFPKVYEGRVEELDWSTGVVGIKLGQPAYNLVDAVRGPEIEESRNRAAAGVASPAGLTVSPSEPGVVVKVNPFFESSVVGIEVYGGTDVSDVLSGSKETFLARGGSNRFEFPQLQPGVEYFFAVRSYDNAGNFSDLVGPKSATSGFIPQSKVSFVVDSGEVSESFSTSASFSSGSVVSDSGGVVFTVNNSDGFTVPAGKLWKFMFATNSVGFSGDATPVNYEVSFSATDTATSNVVKNSFPSGDYSGLEFSYNYDAYCFNSGSGLTFNCDVNWVVFQLDV